MVGLIQDDPDKIHEALSDCCEADRFLAIRSDS